MNLFIFILLYTWVFLNRRSHLCLSRVIEMPYAYQCCVYGSCDSYKSAAQWDTEQGIGDDDPHKRTIALYPSHTDTHCKSIATNMHTDVNVIYCSGYQTADGDRWVG